MLHSKYYCQYKGGLSLRLQFLTRLTLSDLTNKTWSSKVCLHLQLSEQPWSPAYPNLNWPEFAKLCGFRAYVPYVPTCLRALRAYAPHVPTCLRASNYYVPSCLLASNCYVPTCLRVFVPQITTCLRTFLPQIVTSLRAYVPIYIFHANTSSCLKLFCTCVRSFFTCLRAYNHAQNILSFTSIPCIAVFFLIIWPFIPFKTPKQTPAGKTAYPNPIL